MYLKKLKKTVRFLLQSISKIVKYFFLTRSRKKNNKNSIKSNIVKVYQEDSNLDGWILNRLNDELLKHNQVIKITDCKKIKAGDVVFFNHYNLYVNQYLLDSSIFDNVFVGVYFTHSEKYKHNIPNFLLNKIMGTADVIFTMNSNDQKILRSSIRDVSIENVMIGYSDDFVSEFNITERKANKRITIGIVAAYYERKNPKLIFKIIEFNKDFDFIIVGNSWERFEKFIELMSFNNVSYFNVDYDQYPLLYRNFDLLLSCSFVEGGPVPVLESLACGIPVVSTRTGFCCDLIVQNKNGLFLEFDDDLVSIREKLIVASKIKINKIQDLTDLTWHNFTNKICRSLLD